MSWTIKLIEGAFWLMGDDTDGHGQPYFIGPFTLRGEAERVQRTIHNLSHDKLQQVRS
jgi:hypothetical protein